MSKVSIITPVYNASSFLMETAESIFGQTYQDWEWILINDCSTDNSLELIRQLAAKDPRIKFLTNETNLNAAKSRNRGIELATGKYIAFVDSDDLWVPEKLQKQVDFMKRKDASFSYHSYTKFYDPEKKITKRILAPEKLSFNDIIRTCPIGSLAAMYDVEKVGKIFMPDGYRAREDYLCWFEILRKCDFAYGIQESLGYYRVLPGSYSGNKLRAAKEQWRVYRNYLHLNLFDASLNFTMYALHGYMNHKH